MIKYRNPWTRPDLIDEAQKRTKMFVNKIENLISKNRFDIIIAPGNSGIMMAKITELTYKNLNLTCPPIIRIPIYLRNRTGKLTGFDNSVLIPSIKKQLKGIDKIEKILFVDDDASNENPQTFKESIKLIKEAGEHLISNSLTVFMVVEERKSGGLKRVKQLKTVIKYYPFSKMTKEWKAISNFVSYGIPWDIQKEVRKYYSDKVVSSKELFCILLKEPIRDFNGTKPILSHRQENKMKKKIKNFAKMQTRFERHIKNIIKSK